MANDDPGPAWPRHRGIYPSHLRCYLECPRRFRLEYLERRPTRPIWQAAMEKGNALHKIMEVCASQLRRGQRPTVNAHAIAARCLPTHQYAHPAQREADIEEVLTWARGAYPYVARRDTTILAVEQRHQWAWPRRHGRLTFGAKADLVRVRRDGVGEYVEVVDYKTGKGQSFPYLPPLLTRLALSHLLRYRLPQQASPRVVFTWLWLQSGEIESLTIDRAWLTAHWGRVDGHIAALLAERHWPARPSHLCYFCPFYQTHCHPDLTGA